MKKIVVLASLILLPLASAQASELKPYEMPRTEVAPIQENGTDRQYELYVKLPEDYAENADTRYPVIYTTDAVVHMDMLSGSTEFLMPEVILVGISYQKNHVDVRADASRFRDYSVTAFNNPENQARFQGGQASNHLDFIRNEVMPYVETRYRTIPSERTYFGYSLGGTFGAYILLAQPDTFKHYILGSPAFGTTGLPYIDEFEAETALRQDEMNVNVFVSLGEQEADQREKVDHFIEVLRRRSEAGLALTGLEIIEDSNHSTAFPETVIRGVKWLSKRSSNPNQYLGQTPPGLTPEPFAPGIVTTTGWEYGGAFTPDMKEFYFLRNDEENNKQEFVVFENENGRWHETVLGPRVGQAFIAPDGKTMYLGKRFKVRTVTGWSERESLGSPFEEISIMRLTSSAKGTFVFDEVGTDGDGVIRYSRLIDGKREDPRPLPKEINTGTWNAHPFIASDESYILWDGKREGGYGDSDIYLSFRQRDGSWGEAINLGDKINTDAWEAGASVTPDGKYLFFNRNMGSDSYDNVDIFWVDAQVIENLRPKMQTK